MNQKHKPVTNTLEVQHFSLWGKLARQRIPLSFDLEVTARCNLNCRHCYINLPAGDREAQARELSTVEILNIARQAVDLGALWCLVTGGEPLLRKDFPEIYLGLKRQGLLVSVFTNGSLIDKEHIELFKKYPPRDIETTVYGVTGETYEAVTRSPGSFKRFMTSLEMLRENGVPVRLKVIALRSNLREQQAMADFCRKWTKDFHRFDPQLHLRFDGDCARNEEIRAERLTADEIVALEMADEKRVEAMQNKCDTLINDQYTRIASDRLIYCGAGTKSFNVGYDGRFRLCSSLWAEGTTYDLKAGTLADAWNNFVLQVREMRSQSNDFLESCRKCDIVNLCLWCPAHAHLETGMLDGQTPYFCEVAHKRAEIVRKIGRKL